MDYEGDNNERSTKSKFEEQFDDEQFQEKDIIFEDINPTQISKKRRSFTSLSDSTPPDKMKKEDQHSKEEINVNDEKEIIKFDSYEELNDFLCDYEKSSVTHFITGCNTKDFTKSLHDTKMSGSIARLEYLTDYTARGSNKHHSNSTSTLQEFLCSIDIDTTPPAIRGNGLVCTIGPACQSVEKLGQLIESGMNIARLNFSHGNYEYHLQTIKNVREAADKTLPHPVAIALDTKGPEIRTGMMKSDGNVTYKTGQDLRVSSDPSVREQCDEKQQYLEYPSLCQTLKPGDKIFIADGMLALKVKSIVDEKNLIATVLNDATIGSRKNCNLPGAIIDLPAVSEKDKKDLLFGVQNNVDMVFASFIRKKEDIAEVRSALGEQGKHIKIIAKIENHEGIIKIDEIIETADGVMVARGDMGMEIPLEKVFLAQKLLIAKCNRAGKPVICATQMLESMIKNPRPTRAEITDVGNAVTDGADCVMLSGETASGAYPVESVSFMHKICREAATAINHRRVFEELKSCNENTSDTAESIAISAVSASYQANAAAIIVLTTSGRSAWYLSNYHPSCPIIVITRNSHVARCAHLYRGLFPLLYTCDRKETWTEDLEARLDFGMKKGYEMGFIYESSKVVFVCGYQPGSSTTNTLRILEMKGRNIIGQPEKEITFPSGH